MKNIIRTTFRQVIAENRLEFLKKKYTAEDAKQKIGEKVLLQLIAADPTTRPENPSSMEEVKKVGDYTNWIIQQYLKILPKNKNPKGELIITPDEAHTIEMFLEDLFMITERLHIFDVAKRRNRVGDRKDIMTFKTVQELIGFTNQFNIDDIEFNETDDTGRDEFLKVQYEDTRWLVVTPLNYITSKKYFGSPVSTWCTASNEGHFRSYTSSGTLYVVIDKKGEPQKERLAPYGKVIAQGFFDGHRPEFNIAASDNQSAINVSEFFSDKSTNGLKKFFHPILKKMVADTPFSMNDRGWTIYLSVYGASGEIRDVIHTSLVNVIKTNKSSFSDEDKNETNLQQYCTMLGYDVVLDTLFEHMSSDVDTINIMFSNYQGAYQVKDLSRFKNVVSLILGGFVASIPDSISEMESLAFLYLAGNKQLKTLPESVCNLPNLNGINIIGTPVQLPDCLEQRTADGAENMLIVMR